MNKYFYPIFKLPTFYERDYIKEELPLWIKWWLLGKAGRELSEILTGSEFTLLHTLNKKFKILNIKGQTSQVQLTGKNLLDLSNLETETIEGITYTPHYENGLLQYVNVNGTATANSVYSLKTSFELASGSYVLNGCPSSGSWSTYSLDYGNKNDSGSGNSFTLEESYSGQAYIRIGNGTTVNNIKFYPMIRLSSVTDNSYEPYCGGIPAPNSIYKIPIKNVTGNANVKIQNKNLFDYSTTQQVSYYIDPTNGNKYTADGNYISDYISVKENITYVRNNIKFIDNLTFFSSLTFYDGNKNYLSGQWWSTTTFTTPVNAKYIRLCTSTNRSSMTEEVQSFLQEFQLEEGTTATTYVEHQEQNLPFTFSEGQRLMQGGELQDGGIYNTRKQIEITAENVDSLVSNISTAFNVSAAIIPKEDLGYENTWLSGIALINNYYEIKASGDEKSGSFATNFNRFNVYIFDDRFTDLETAKSLLIGTIIEIEQAEEEIIPYNSTQQAEYNAIKQARSNDDMTIISSESDELPPLLDIQYWKERGAE